MLKTAKIHNMMAVSDAREPIQYIYEKYVQQTGQRAYSIGCSMGANITTNMLGVDGDASILSGAVMVHTAIKKWEALSLADTRMGKIYNSAMGKYMFDFVQNNIEVLQPHFEKELGIDLSKQIEETEEKDYFTYHKLVTAPLNGY